MAMRGEDVIGIQQNPQAGGLLFLKTEAKSRVALSGAVVTEARAGLKDGGLPSAHALFIADRLAGAWQILRCRMRSMMRNSSLAYEPQSVRHLLFTFSGNDPGSSSHCVTPDGQAADRAMERGAAGRRPCRLCCSGL